MLEVPHDAAHDDAEWRDFLAERDFGQLVVGEGDDGVPMVTPAHYRFDGRSTLELHLHRAHPAWRAIEHRPRVLFAVVDAHVYIPTDWNAPPGTDPAWSAPTSYYAAVQVVGRAVVVDDPARIASLLRRQMLRMQPEGGHAPIEPGPSPFGRMLRHVRGLRLPIESVRAKFKFGGNRSRRHRELIAGRLAARGAPGDAEAREHLLRRLRDEELAASTTCEAATE